MNEERIIHLGKHLYLIKLIVSTGVFFVSVRIPSWTLLLALFKLYRWLWFLNIDPLFKILLPVGSIITMLMSMATVTCSWVQMTLLEKTTYLEFLVSYIVIIGLAIYGLILKFTYPPQRPFHSLIEAG